MALELGVLLPVLLAAILHASWNALVKAGDDRLVMTTLVIAVPSLPCLAALFVLPAAAAKARLKALEGTRYGVSINNEERAAFISSSSAWATPGARPLRPTGS